MQRKLISPDWMILRKDEDTCYGLMVMKYGVDTYRPAVSDEEARAGNFMNAAQAERLILSRRAQAVEEKFLVRYLRESDSGGAVTAAIRESYEKEMGYYFLRSAGP